jgi:drug/metabolite transporter (DMT)-like permease
MLDTISQRRLWVMFLVLGGLVAWVMVQVELPMLMGWNPAWDARIDSYRVLLHVHATAGSAALFVAPLQLLPFRRIRRLHRPLGYAYLLAICVGAPTAIWIALDHMSGAEQWLTCAQAVAWLYATVVAVVAIVQRRVDMHRIWITRSYALTYTFILSRLAIDVLHYRPGPEIGGNPGFILLSSLLVLILADLFSIKRRRWSPA